MVSRVCVDSDVLISLLRQDAETRDQLKALEADYCVSAITSFELWHGRRGKEPVAELLSWLDVMPLDDMGARLAADLLRELKNKGKPMDLRDLFIAATCIRNNVPLLTHNTKHFDAARSFGLELVG